MYNKSALYIKLMLRNDETGGVRQTWLFESISVTQLIKLIIHL